MCARFRDVPFLDVQSLGRKRRPRLRSNSLNSVRAALQSGHCYEIIAFSTACTDPAARLAPGSSASFSMVALYQSMRGPSQICRWLLSFRYGHETCLFDREYYRRSYPDVAASGTSPWLHFLLVGGFEARNPHPLFNTAFYLSSHADVAASGWNPLLHYLKYGSSGHGQPHPLFDPAFYLQRYPDVREAGLNPLLHYVLHGADEGRKPHPLFQPDYYLRNCPDARQSGAPALVHFLRSSGNWADPHPLFNCRTWLQHNPAAANSGINPLVHYVLSDLRTRARKEGVQFGLASTLAAIAR